jgi:hypothetical protein
MWTYIGKTELPYVGTKSTVRYPSLGDYIYGSLIGLLEAATVTERDHRKFDVGFDLSGRIYNAIS